MTIRWIPPSVCLVPRRPQVQGKDSEKKKQAVGKNRRKKYRRRGWRAWEGGKRKQLITIVSSRPYLQSRLKYF